jgi:hypothetical protein
MEFTIDVHHVLCGDGRFGDPHPRVDSRMRRFRWPFASFRPERSRRHLTTLAKRHVIGRRRERMHPMHDVEARWVYSAE